MAGVGGATTRSNSGAGSPRTPVEPEPRRASVRLSAGGACCLLLPRCCLVSYSRSHLRTYALVASALVAPTSRSHTRQIDHAGCRRNRNAARAIEHGQRPCDWTPSHLLPGLHRICSQPSHASPRPSLPPGAGVVGVCAGVLGFYVLGLRERKRAKGPACAEYQHSSLCTGLRAGLERQVMTL